MVFVLRLYLEQYQKYFTDYLLITGWDKSFSDDFSFSSAEALLPCMESKEILNGEANLEGHEDPEVCACWN